jgi:VIT1/CCC1 family predicted Fe2+/Mn2+ transporter
MTKWARMRRRKERERVAKNTAVSEEPEPKLAEPKKISDNVRRSQEIQKPDTRKTSKPSKILTQIPRYVYLIAIFALLSGIFFPLITPGGESAYSFVVGGIATLFLGLAGGILLFKATKSDKNQGIFIAVGFALLAISLALIFLIQNLFKEEFVL